MKAYMQIVDLEVLIYQLSSYAKMLGCTLLLSLDIRYYTIDILIITMCRKNAGWIIVVIV